MSGWKTTRLGDLCSHVTSGGTPLRSVREYYEGGTIPWLKTGEVKKGYVWEVEEYITERGLKESSAKLIPANSLIVAMYGDGNTAGNVAINKVPLATNQACCNFTLNPKIADYRYVYHYLKGSYSNLVGLKLSLSGILCVRHNMMFRKSMYAKQEESSCAGGKHGGVAADS